MPLILRLAETDADLSLAAEVLAELRTHLSVAELLTRIHAQREHGYQIALALGDGEPLGAAGFVIGLKLAWGRHLYVDDLVTREQARSTGIGARLLDWLRVYALEQGCEQLHLDSGVQRFAAHRFYLRHGFQIASHHFSIPELGAGGSL